MSNKLQQLILGLSLAGFAAGAWAQGGPDGGTRDEGHGDWGHGEYHHHHHHHHHHYGWGLKLTDAQKQQMHTILDNARQNAMKDGPGGMSDHMALMNPGDPKYAAAVQDAKKRAADRVQHMSDLKQQLYNVLTAEQKSEVQKRIASWKTRMAQHEDPGRGPDGSKGPPAPANR